MTSDLTKKERREVNELAERIMNAQKNVFVIKDETLSAVYRLEVCNDLKKEAEVLRRAANRLAKYLQHRDEAKAVNTTRETLPTMFSDIALIERVVEGREMILSIESKLEKLETSHSQRSW